MELVTLLVTATILVIVWTWLGRHDPRLPPCPVRPWPIFGHIFHLGFEPRPHLKKWMEQCGGIYSLYIGGKLAIVLSGYDTIKEAFVKKADVFTDRPQFFVNKAVDMENTGIIFSSGPLWKELRSVGIAALRNFGMGKNLLAEKIQEEVGCYVKYLASLGGEPTDIRTMTNVSTSNIICSILIGQRFEYDDEYFQSLMHKLCSLVGDHGSVSFINYMLWLRHLPGDIFKAKTLAVSIKGVMESLMKVIEEKQRHVVDSSDVCNMIDAYTVERNKKLQAGMSTYLDDKNLLRILMDLFQAGSETSSSAIYWCILYVLNNKGVQEKAFQEIQENVGTARPPNSQDKPRLTYLNAVIAETLRLSSMVPLALSHICSEEVTLRGYTIPKGATIIPNLDSVLHDKATWGDDVMSFRPERFIDNGKLKIPEQHIPFGIGRRVCMGEAMANMEIFLYLSTMFQKFEFLSAVPGPIPSVKHDCAIVVTPLPYKVRVIERK